MQLDIKHFLTKIFKI